MVILFPVVVAGSAARHAATASSSAAATLTHRPITLTPSSAPPPFRRKRQTGMAIWLWLDGPPSLKGLWRSCVVEFLSSLERTKLR
jgi:hypothetical protein